MAAISAAELDATWRQLERVPRPDLARALARARASGAAAFKRKDYQGAYDHYNQAVTGLEYLARTGADATERDVVRALANARRALGRGDAAGAARDAAGCARREPAWPKAWYRPGRALFAQDKFGDASQAFDEGARLEPDNARVRARASAPRAGGGGGRRAAPRGATRRTTRASTVNDGDGDGGGGGRRGPARSGAPSSRRSRRCDLMRRKQQAQIDQQAPADIYYVQTMLRLPQATRPAELEGQTALAAVVAYLERASALAAAAPARAEPTNPMREWSRRRGGRPRRFRRAGAAARRGGGVGRRESGASGAGWARRTSAAAWLHVGAGCGRSLARCARAAAGPVRALAVGPAAGARDVLAANGLADAVSGEAPVEEVFDAAPPAVVVVVDPDLFDGASSAGGRSPTCATRGRTPSPSASSCPRARASSARRSRRGCRRRTACPSRRWTGTGGARGRGAGPGRLDAGAGGRVPAPAPPVPCAELDFCAADVEAAPRRARRAWRSRPARTAS